MFLIEEKLTSDVYNCFDFIPKMYKLYGQLKKEIHRHVFLILFFKPIIYINKDWSYFSETATKYSVMLVLKTRNLGF